MHRIAIFKTGLSLSYSWGSNDGEFGLYTQRRQFSDVDDDSQNQKFCCSGRVSLISLRRVYVRSNGDEIGSYAQRRQYSRQMVITVRKNCYPGRILPPQKQRLRRVSMRMLVNWSWYDG